MIPQFADQPYNADRIAALGSGLAISPENAGREVLADAVARMVGEPSLRTAAGTIAREIRTLADRRPRSDARGAE